MGKSKQKKIAVADAETDPFKEGRLVEPFIWGYYDGENYEEFTDTIEFCHFLSELEDTIVYMHNGGKFDFHLGILPFANDFQEVKIINGRVGKFELGDCEIRDSVLILPIALADYQKTKIDYAIFEKEERYKPENWKKITEYLYDDCRFLYDLVHQFIDQYGVNLTLAGTAFKFWEEMSGERVEKSCGEYYDLFAPFYYGGRVECFQKGVVKKDFQFMDINSAYPYAMLFKHPYSLTYSETEEIEVSEMMEILEEENAGGMLFDIEGISKGALPYREGKLLNDGTRSESDKELFFPNDNEVRRYTVTGWEIIAGIETGTLDIHKCNNVVLFDEYRDFAPYINHFYEARKKAKAIGDQANNIFCKLMMNALYGRFAMYPERYRTYVNIPPEFAFNIGEPNSPEIDAVFDKMDIKRINMESFEDAGHLSDFVLMQRKLYESEKTFYNIATSASITGFVRAYMWKHLCKTENPIYCDTDSIAAEKFINFEEGKELGQWETEGNFQMFAVGGKKMYAFAYVAGEEKENKKTGETEFFKTASKGVKFSAEQIIRVASGEKVLFQPEVPTYSYNKEPTFLQRIAQNTVKIATER